MSFLKHLTTYLSIYCLIISLAPSSYGQDVNFQTKAKDAIENLDPDNSTAALRRTADNQTKLSSAEHSQGLAGQYAEQVALTYALVEYLDKDCKADPIYKQMVPSFDMLGNTASFQHTLFEATKLKKDVAQASAINAELGGCKNYQIDDVRRAIALIDAQLKTVEDHINNFDTSKEMYLAAAEQTRAEDEKRSQEINGEKKKQGAGIAMVIVGIAMVALGLALSNFGLVAAGTALIAAGIMMQQNAEKDMDKKKRMYTMQCNDHCYHNDMNYKYQDTPNACTGTVDTNIPVPTLDGKGLIIPSTSSGSSGSSGINIDSNGSGGSNNGDVDNSTPISRPAEVIPQSTFLSIFISYNAYAQDDDVEVDAQGRRVGQNERGEFVENSTANATKDINNDSTESYMKTIEPILRERNNVLMATPKSRYEYLMHVAEQMEEASSRAAAVKADLQARKKALMELERRLLAQQQSLAGADGGTNNDCTNPLNSPDRLNQSVTLGDKDYKGVGCVKRSAKDTLIADATCECRENDTCASVKDNKITTNKKGPFDTKTNALLAENQQIVRDLTNKAFRGEGSSDASKALRGKLSANTNKIRSAISKEISTRKKAELSQLQKASPAELKNLGLTEKEVDNASAILKKSSSSSSNPFSSSGSNTTSSGKLPDQEETAGQEGSQSGQEITTVGGLGRGGSGSGDIGSGKSSDPDLDDLNEPYNFDVSGEDLAVGGAAPAANIGPLSDNELSQLEKDLNKSKYDANDRDSLFGRVTKAYIRAAYPVLLKRRPAADQPTYIIEDTNPSQ
jgi:hypothetical protein